MKLIAAAFSLFAAVATAQPLTFVTLTGAGSFSDTAIRQAAPAIERRTGRPVVVVNAPGANGLIGLQQYMSQPADGNTFLVGNSSIGYLAFTGQFKGELKPVIGLSQTDLAIYSRAEIQAVNSLVSRPALKAASTSPMTDLSICLFDVHNRTSTTVVGYKQFGQALVDVSSGRIDYLVAPVGATAVEAMITAQKLQRLHVLGPSFAWNAVFTHHNTKNDLLVAKLKAAIKETSFVGMRHFDADTIGVLHLQQQEAAVMARCISPSNT